MDTYSRLFTPWRRRKLATAGDPVVGGCLGERNDNEGTTPSFRDLAEALGLGMPFQIAVPPEGGSRVFTFVGENCREMIGVEPAAVLADAMVILGRILPDQLEAFAATEQAARAARRNFDMDVRMLGPDGEVRWRRIVAAPSILADGATLWNGVMSDITEARTAAAEVQEERRRLEIAVEATGLGLWDLDVGTGALAWSDRNRELFGLPPGEAVSLERYMSFVHPDDRGIILSAYQQAAEQPDGGDLVYEYRAIIEGVTRWLQARGRVIKDDDGAIRTIGANIDISERKAAEERRALLMGELAHRAKNGIAVMMAVVASTARNVSTVAEFRDVLNARLQAMVDSQDLVTQTGGRPVKLADLFDKTLTPFDVSRFDIDGSLVDVTLPGEMAVALGLLLHELSTNAAKYGALSSAAGRVAVRRADGGPGETVLTWAETGGPPVSPPARSGFGSRVLAVALQPQGGKVDARYEPAGFKAHIHLPKIAANPIVTWPAMAAAGAPG